MKIANNYNDIDWKQCRKDLSRFRLQYNIIKAFRIRNAKETIRMQHELVRSFAARSLAVRKVTTNQSRLTPSINGIVLDTKKKKFQAIHSAKNLSGYVAMPVRRVKILQANNKLRPLGIPTIRDRIVQTLFVFALDPITEKTVDTRNYGFCLHRGVHENIIYLKLVLRFYVATKRYIFEVDIAGFFHQ